MGNYIRKRLLCLIPILILISLVSFFLMYLSPGDPARMFLSQGGDAPTDAAIEALREQLGLNRPLPEQYLTWAGKALHGDLGVSISTGKPVAEEICRYFPNTLKLTLVSMLLTLLVSLPLGIWSAVRQNRLTDYLIRFCTFVTSSLPGFFAAILLIYVLAVRLRWLPTISTGSEKGIILPALTLTITMSAGYIRQVRTAMIRELQEEYIRMERARGIREHLILYNGALRSALPSILTIAGINVGHLLGGSSIIELVCTYPGIGRLAIQAINSRDYPVVQGYVLVMAVVYVLVNLLADLLHAASDPRVRRQILVQEGGRLHEKKA